MRQKIRLFSLIPFVLFSLLIGGCATQMSQTECLSADWYTIGLEDGTRGQTMSRLSHHRKQCGEFGVTPDVQAYQQGRYDGLDYFCTLANGLAVGKRGQAYNNVCPSEMQYYFLTGYRLGREIHRVNSDIRQNRAKVTSIEKEINSDQVTSERRAELRYQLRSLEQDFGRMQSRLEYLELEERRVVVAEPTPMASN